MSSTLGERQFGAYRIGALAGRGPAGAVHAARDVRSGLIVALKLFHPDWAQDDAYARRVMCESQRADALRHPNIIPLLDAGALDGELYTATRFARGGDVRALMEDEGRLAPARALFIAQQVAHALDTAHAKGVLHGHVAPPNVLVERLSSHVYLRDFGIHVPVDSSGARAADPRNDVRGLAGVLYELLSGGPPPVVGDDLAGRIANGDLPQLEAVLRRALADEPRQGYASGGELVSAVRAALRPRRASVPAAAPIEAVPVAAPALEPRDDPPATVVAPTRERPRSVRPAWTRGMLHGTPLAVVAAAAAVFAYFGERALSDHASAIAGARPAVAGQGAAGTRPPTGGSDAALLRALHDPAIGRTCRPLNASGRVAALACSALAPHGALVDLRVSRFGSDSAAARAFRDETQPAVQASGGPVGVGSRASAGVCDPSAWLGSGAWRSAPGYSGQVACFITTPSSQGCGGVPAPRCAVLDLDLRRRPPRRPRLDRRGCKRPPVRLVALAPRGVRDAQQVSASCGPCVADPSIETYLAASPLVVDTRMLSVPGTIETCDRSRFTE